HLDARLDVEVGRDEVVLHRHGVARPRPALTPGVAPEGVIEDLRTPVTGDVLDRPVARPVAARLLDEPDDLPRQAAAVEQAAGAVVDERRGADAGVAEEADRRVGEEGLRDGDARPLAPREDQAGAGPTQPLHDLLPRRPDDEVEAVLDAEGPRLVAQ